MLHPIKYRLSINKFWLSTWNSYSLKNYRNLILNDKILKVLGIIFSNCFKMNYPLTSPWSNNRKVWRLTPAMRRLKKLKHIGFDGRVSIQIGPYKLKKLPDFILPENYRIVRFSNFSILKICFLIDENVNWTLKRNKKLRSPLTNLNLYYAHKSKKKTSPIFRNKLSKFLTEKKNFKSTGYFIYITNLLKNKNIRRDYYGEFIPADRNLMKIEREEKEETLEIEEELINIFREPIIKYINNNRNPLNTTLDSIIDRWLKKIGQIKLSAKFKNYLKHHIRLHNTGKLREKNFIEGTKVQPEMAKLAIPYLKDRMGKRFRMDFSRSMRYEEAKEMVRELDFIEEEEEAEREQKKISDDKKYWDRELIVPLLSEKEQEERIELLKKRKFNRDLADLERYFGFDIKDDRIKARKSKKKSFISRFNNKQQNNRLMIFNFYYNNFVLLNKIRNNYFLFYFKDSSDNNNRITKTLFLKNNIMTSSIDFLTFSNFFSSNKTYSKFANRKLQRLNQINTNKKDINFKFLSKKSRLKQKFFYFNSINTKVSNCFFTNNSKKLINHFNLINTNFNKIKTFNNINNLSYYNNINFLFSNLIKPRHSNFNSKISNRHKSKHSLSNNSNFLKSILFLNSFSNTNKQFSYNLKKKLVKKIKNNINLFGIKSYLVYLSKRYSKKKYNLYNNLVKKSAKKFKFKIVTINSNLKLWFLKKVKKQKNFNAILYKRRISYWYDFNMHARRFLHFSNIISLKTLAYSPKNKNINKILKFFKSTNKNYSKSLNKKRGKKKVFNKLFNNYKNTLFDNNNFKLNKKKYKKKWYFGLNFFYSRLLTNKINKKKVINKWFKKANNILLKNNYFKLVKNQQQLKKQWYHVSKLFYSKLWNNNISIFPVNKNFTKKLLNSQLAKKLKYKLSKRNSKLLLNSFDSYTPFFFNKKYNFRAAITKPIFLKNYYFNLKKKKKLFRDYNFKFYFWVAKAYKTRNRKKKEYKWVKGINQKRLKKHMKNNLKVLNYKGLNFYGVVNSKQSKKYYSKFKEKNKKRLGIVASRRSIFRKFRSYLYDCNMGYKDLGSNELLNNNNKHSDMRSYINWGIRSYHKKNRFNNYKKNYYRKNNFNNNKGYNKYKKANNYYKFRKDNKQLSISSNKGKKFSNKKNYSIIKNKFNLITIYNKFNVTSKKKNKKRLGIFNKLKKTNKNKNHFNHSKGYNKYKKANNDYKFRKNNRQLGISSIKWKKFKNKKNYFNFKRRTRFLNNKKIEILNYSYKISILNQKLNLLKLVKDTFNYKNNYANFFIFYKKNKNRLILKKNNFFLIKSKTNYISSYKKNKFSFKIRNKKNRFNPRKGYNKYKKSNKDYKFRKNNKQLGISSNKWKKFKNKKNKFKLINIYNRFKIKSKKRTKKIYKSIFYKKTSEDKVNEVEQDNNSFIYHKSSYNLDKLPFSKKQKKTKNEKFKFKIKRFFFKKKKKDLKSRPWKHITYWAFKSFTQAKQNYWRKTYYINYCRTKPKKYISYHKFNNLSWEKKKELKKRYFVSFYTHQNRLNKASYNFRIWWPNNYIMDALYNRSNKLKLKYLFWSKYKYNKQLLNNKIRNFLINNFLITNKNCDFKKKFYLQTINKKFNRFLKVKNNFLVNSINNKKYSIFLYNSFKNSFTKKLFSKSNLNTNAINNYYRNFKKVIIPTMGNKICSNNESFHFMHKSLISLLNSSISYSNFNLFAKFKYQKHFSHIMKKNINNIFKLFLLAKKHFKKKTFLTKYTNLNKDSLYLLNNFNLTNRLFLDNKKFINNKIKYIKYIFKKKIKSKKFKNINFKNIGLLNYSVLRAKSNINSFRLNNTIATPTLLYNSSLVNNQLKKIYLNKKKNYIRVKKEKLLKKYLYDIFYKRKCFFESEIKNNRLESEKLGIKFFINDYFRDFFGSRTLTRPIRIKSNRKKRFGSRNPNYIFQNFSSNINFIIKNKVFFINNNNINSFKKLQFFNSQFGMRSAYFQLSKFKTKGLNKFIINNANYTNHIFTNYYKNSFLSMSNLNNLTLNFILNNKNFNKNNFDIKKKFLKFNSINTNLSLRNNSDLNYTFDFKIFLNMRRKRGCKKKKHIKEVMHWILCWWCEDSGEKWWRIAGTKQSPRMFPLGPVSLAPYTRYLSYKKFILPKVYSTVNKRLALAYYTKLALKKKTLHKFYKTRNLPNIVPGYRKYLYHSMWKNKNFNSLSVLNNIEEFCRESGGYLTKKWVKFRKKVRREKRKTKAQKKREEELRKQHDYVHNYSVLQKTYNELLIDNGKLLQRLIFKNPYDPYFIKETNRLALKKKDYPKLINYDAIDKNFLLLPPIRYKFKKFSPIFGNHKIFNYNKFICKKNINKSQYLPHSKFYSKFTNSCKQIIDNFNSGLNLNIFKYKIYRNFYFLKNKFIKTESICFKSKVNSNLLFNKNSFLFNLFFKSRVKKKRFFFSNSKNLIFNQYIPFRMKNFFLSKKKLIELKLFKYRKFRQHYQFDLDYKSFAILKELEMKRKMRWSDKLKRTRKMYSRRFQYWTHLKWFNKYINKHINNKTFKYYDLYYSFKSYEKFKKLNFYYLLSLGKKNSLNNKTRNYSHNIIYLNDLLKLKLNKINYYITYFKSKNTFLTNKYKLSIKSRLLKNWVHSIKFSTNISKRIRYVTHLKYKPMIERLYLWRINKRKVKKLTKFYKEQRRSCFDSLKDDSTEPEEKSQIYFHLKLMKRRFIKFKYMHSSPLTGFLKHIKKKIKKLVNFMNFWIPSNKRKKWGWKQLKRKRSLHSNYPIWYKKKGFFVNNQTQFCKYYLVSKLYRSSRFSEDHLIIDYAKVVKKFVEYLFFVLFKFTNLRLFYKKIYRINAMSQKAKLFKNLFNYRLATGFKVPFLVKIIYQKLSYDKDLIGCKIGFFGRYSKKLRNRKIWKYIRYLKPSNLNTPLDYYNVVILQQWGITGFKLTMLRKKTVDLLFLTHF